jgi:hypothetical protein
VFRTTLLAAVLLLPAVALAQTAPGPVSQSTLAPPAGMPAAAPAAAPAPLHPATHAGTAAHPATHHVAAKTTHKPVHHVAAKSSHKPVHHVTKRTTHKPVRHVASVRKPHATHVAHETHHVKKPATKKL